MDIFLFLRLSFLYVWYRGSIDCFYFWGEYIYEAFLCGRKWKERGKGRSNRYHNTFSNLAFNLAFQDKPSSDYTGRKEPSEQLKFYLFMIVSWFQNGSFRIFSVYRKKIATNAIPSIR